MSGCALEQLGPIFVKFGQILSTRRDLLPDDIAIELARLQDQVQPFPGAQARTLIEKSYGQPIAKIFAEFDETPLASASIAQVHTARLHDAKDVVVKVVRPKILRVIQRDLSLLYYVAGLAERYWREGRRLRPVEVIHEFETTLLDELDLLREAANASQLRRNFSGSKMLYVPEVYWPQCRREVMVMERISGVPISNVSELRAQGIDVKLLAERGVEIFFTQVFRHNLASRMFNVRGILTGGGVAANSRLRQRLKHKSKELAIPVFYPSVLLCTDNAAMVAGLAYKKYLDGDISTLDIEAVP